MAKIVDYGSLIHFRSKPPAAINYTIYPVAIFELPFLNIKEVLWATVRYYATGNLWLKH